MIDLSHIPFGGKLPPEIQAEFERRALALDDNSSPPVFRDKDGNYIEDYGEA